MRLSNRCFAVTGLCYLPPWSVNAGFVTGDETTLIIDTGANAAAAKDPAKKALLDQRDQIETAIDELKYEKAGMAADDYKKQLTRLLLELSRLQVEIDK